MEMNSNLVVTPQRADALRHLLLVLAALAGLAASAYVLSSQVAADFLREGPVRFTGLEGETLRVVLGLGALAATGIAVGALWPRVQPACFAVAAPALAGGLFLIHVLLMPAVVLVGLALAADFLGHLPRERVQKVIRLPVVWVGGGVISAASVAGLVLVSIWLVGPLFDEGTTLNEMLDFEVAGVVQPDVIEPAAAMGETESVTAAVSPAEPAVPRDEVTAPAEAAPAEMEAAVSSAPVEMAAATTVEPAAPDTPAARSGTLIARGELMGTDAFHTGSGEVLLVSDPDGNLILRFQDYAVRNGPDLFVYLTPDPDGDVHAEGAVDLGEIRATQGFVNYEVPAGVDASRFRAAVIYCKAFSVTFAVASLQ